MGALAIWDAGCLYRGFFYGGVAHQGVFEVDGADPFAAGFYEDLWRDRQF